MLSIGLYIVYLKSLFKKVCFNDSFESRKILCFSSFVWKIVPHYGSSSIESPSIKS